MDGYLNARDVARLSGLRRYHGRPCRICAATERYASCTGCVACTRRRAYASKLKRRRKALHNGSLHNSRALNRLRLAAGGIVSHAELVEAIWRSPEDGGPEYAVNMVRRAMFELRRLGYPIRNHARRGYAYAWTHKVLFPELGY